MNTAGNTTTARRILSLAVPALGALIAEPLFTLIDSAMVGHLGTAPLAGLSVASQVLQSVVVLFIFLAYSTTSLTARTLGAGDHAGALRAGIDAMWLAAGLGVLAAIAVATCGPLFFAMLGATGQTATHAGAYLWTCAPGMVGMFVVLAATGTLRGLQDTRTPLYVTVAGTVFNVGANALFIYGADMGVAGSGLGTSLTQSLMGVAMVLVVCRGARERRIPLLPSGAGVLRSALDGAPLVIRGLALRLAGLATIWPLTRMGTEPLAAYQVVLAVWTLGCFVLDALAIAAQSMVGLARGAGDEEGLRELLRVLTKWGVWAGLLLAVVVAAASPWLPAAFGTDPLMRSLATWGLLACCAGMPLGGVVFLLDGVLLGAGENRYLAGAGVVQLIAFLPALGAVEALRRAGAGPHEVLAGVWLAYGLVYMGARTATNAWRTWFSPHHALVPRADVADPIPGDSPAG